MSDASTSVPTATPVPATAPTPAPVAAVPVVPVPAAGAAVAPATAPVATPPVEKTAAADAPVLGLLDEPPAPVVAEKPVEAAPVVEAPKAADWKLELPKEISLHADDLAGIEGTAKKSGLTKEQTISLVSQMAEARKAEIVRYGNDWRAQMAADKEFGGANLDATVADARRALTAFATPEERIAIAKSQLSNHPVLIRLLARAAKALPREDTVITPTVPSKMPGAKGFNEAANLIYGQNKK